MVSPETHDRGGERYAEAEKAVERAEKEPSVGEEEESDCSVPVTTVQRWLMQDQQWLMKEKQESQRQILMEIIEQQRTERYRDKMKEFLARMMTGAGKETTKVCPSQPCKSWVVTTTFNTF